MKRSARKMPVFLDMYTDREKLESASKKPSNELTESLMIVIAGEPFLCSVVVKDIQKLSRTPRAKLLEKELSHVKSLGLEAVRHLSTGLTRAFEDHLTQSGLTPTALERFVPHAWQKKA